MRWHYSQWRLIHDGSWWIDLFLLDQIIQKVMKENMDVELWRFHRRAFSDEAQHQFTFFFYADDDRAKGIQEQIADLKLTTEFEDHGILFEQAIMTNDDMDSTSDPSWPYSIQKAWPYFIGGACRTFVLLMESVKGAIDSDLPVKEYYKEVDLAMSNLWYENGHHAFVHHISALFHGHWCKVNSQMEMIVRY